MDYLESSSDIRLKPRLLKGIVRERLPDEDKPLGDATRLSRVVSVIRMHELLSECRSTSLSEQNERKISAAWSAAVDSWIERCLSLCKSKMPDKCWAGTSLLGLTFELCSSERFLASYSTWFQALLSNLQPLAESDLVKSATCASMSDFFTRLSMFPHLKKDATSLASKIMLPVIQQLSDRITDAQMLAAVDLLSALLKFFPFSVHRHYEKAEEVIISNLLANKCSADVSKVISLYIHDFHNTLVQIVSFRHFLQQKLFLQTLFFLKKKLVRCLTLLPTVRGDESSWNTMIQRLLISINIHLNQVFKGHEEERQSSEAMRLLAPPGTSANILGSEFLSTSAAVELEDLVPRLSILMQACCSMVENPTSRVSLPIHSLILLVERVVSVEGSLHESLSIFSSELHQEILCQELPSIHLSSLELLMAILKSAGSQLLPYVARLKKIMIEFFRRATFPFQRIKLYSILRVLLIKMGVGMALFVGGEVLVHVSDDLSGLMDEKRSRSLDLDQRSGKSKRRKLGLDNARESQNGVDLGVSCGKAFVPLSVQVAALEAVEALVTVAGSTGDQWRDDVDRLLISVATNAFSLSPIISRGMGPGPDCHWANFKLTSLQALLASLLSRSRSRPPYLSQALDLFLQGSREMGTDIGAFCSHALLALEVLIHPRSLSLEPSTAISVDFDRLTSQKSDALFEGDDFALTSADIEPFWRDSTSMEVNVDGEHVLTLGKSTEEKEDLADGNVVSESSTDSREETATTQVNDDQEPLLTLEKSTIDKSTFNEEKVAEGNAISEGTTDLGYDSPSPSLDSLPDIVDADPDSD